MHSGTVIKNIPTAWLLVTLVAVVAGTGNVGASQIDLILGDYIRRPVGGDDRQVNIRIERCGSGYCAIGDTYVSRWRAICEPLQDEVGLDCVMKGTRKDETDTFTGKNFLVLEADGRLTYDYYDLVYDVSGESYAEVFVLERLRPDNSQTVVMESKAKTRALSREDRKTAEQMTGGRYYALLIGVQDYDDDEVEDLDHPVSDARRLRDLLQRKYLFDRVDLLENPTRAQVFQAMDRLQGTLTHGDSLVLFFAGHGVFDENQDQGYWLLKDSTRNGRHSWFGNNTLQKYIRAFPSKHTLLISDSCFSGSVIFKTRSIGNANRDVQKLYALPSRKAMTSGTLKTVPDKSVFMQYLIKRLENNDKDFLPALSLFGSFREAVSLNSPNLPQYGNITSTGGEGGDFIFVKR